MVIPSCANRAEDIPGGFQRDRDCNRIDRNIHLVCFDVSLPVGTQSEKFSLFFQAGNCQTAGAAAISGTCNNIFNK